MSCEFLIGRYRDGLIVRLVGRGTMQESASFRAAIEPSLTAGTVVFDASECDYLDSTFLGCLISINKLCERSPERRFVIAADPKTRIRLFSTSALDKYFDFIDECPQASEPLIAIDIDKLEPEELGRHVMRCHKTLAEMGGDQSRAFQAIADRLADELGE